MGSHSSSQNTHSAVVDLLSGSVCQNWIHFATLVVKDFLWHSNFLLLNFSYLQAVSKCCRPFWLKDLSTSYIRHVLWRACQTMLIQPARQSVEASWHQPKHAPVTYETNTSICVLTVNLKSTTITLISLAAWVGNVSKQILFSHLMVLFLNSLQIVSSSISSYFISCVTDHSRFLKLICPFPSDRGMGDPITASFKSFQVNKTLTKLSLLFSAQDEKTSSILLQNWGSSFQISLRKFGTTDTGHCWLHMGKLPQALLQPWKLFLL